MKVLLEMLKRFGRILEAGEKWAFLAVIAAGVVVWSVTMVKSGWVYAYGMGFWGANGHDGIWHLALIESFLRGSFEMPVFAGETLRNYHVGFDLMVAGLARLTGVAPVRWYFQILPPIMAALIGFLVYRLVYMWRGSRWQAVWAVFFCYFGAGWGWVVEFIRSGTLGGESMFWAQGAISTLINPPYALSLVFIVSGLILVLQLREKLSFSRFLAAVFLWGVLLEVKVYAGILVLVSFWVALLWEFRVKKRQSFYLWGVWGGVVLISGCLYALFFRGSQGVLVWQPGWFLETMMGTDRLNWPKFYEAMVNYKMGGVWLKGGVAYLTAAVIFLLGNLGVRFLGFCSLKKVKEWVWLDVFILTLVICGMVLPMLWVQKGTAWNTVQFFYYSLFFMGVWAGVYFGEWWEKRKMLGRWMLGLAVLGLILPATWGSLRHYLPNRPPAKISNEELTAMAFLRGLLKGAVLTYPFDRAAAEAEVDNPPRPLYLYESTAYVSAFSGKPVYLEDEVNLVITGYDYQLRRERALEFFRTGNITWAKEFLENNGISYIYLTKGQGMRLDEDDLGWKKVFENQEVRVYRKGGGREGQDVGLVR